MFFNVKMDIKIEEVYFSYAFKGEEPDQTTMNYYLSNSINYILFYESKRKLEKSQIDDKINSSFFYLQSPDDMKNSKIELTTFDTNKIKSKGKKYKKELTEELNKLDNIFKKKRT